MSVITILWSFIATLLATAIMSYITMATAIGPWIETVIVLLGTILIHTFLRTLKDKEQFLGLSTAAAGMGGIIATACGFSIPTVYFLKPTIFAQWLAHPYYFCSIMGSLVIAASALGLLVAHLFEPDLLSNPKMSFSVGQLVHKMIAAQNQLHQAYQLMLGMLTSIGIFIGQTVLHILPASFRLLPRLSFGIVTFERVLIKTDLLPLFISIGFVAGNILTMPLLAGVITKIFIVGPLNTSLFKTLSSENMLLAFSSGMILQSSLMSFLDIGYLYRKIRSWIEQKNLPAPLLVLAQLPWPMMIISCLAMIPFFYYFKFSWLAQLYIIVGTIICIYQIVVIAGEIGIAPLGRYATFVMVPGLLLFGFDGVQATIVAAFVEIACGVAVDALFGRKMAQLTQIKRSRVVAYQILGVLVCALSIGIIFWLLISHFGLGSQELFAPRAQPRALLINAYHFDYTVLLIGIIYGIVLKKFKLNPALVLCGLVMSTDVSLMLMAGGLLSRLVNKAENWYPYWSGMFAASSLLMIMKAIVR